MGPTKVFLVKRKGNFGGYPRDSIKEMTFDLGIQLLGRPSFAYLWCSGRRAKSERNVSVTYLWKYVGNGNVVSKSYTRHRFGPKLCMKNTW